MLSKRSRISRKEFPYILAKGKRYNSPHLLLYTAPVNLKNTKNQSKFSFSLAKKVCKKAVDRNKNRRRGYSVIRHLLPRINSGYFCFFSFKKGGGGLTFAILEKEILELLSSSHVLS